MLKSQDSCWHLYMGESIIRAQQVPDFYGNEESKTRSDIPKSKLG